MADSSVSLLVELGMKYVRSGAAQLLQADLAAVAASAKNHAASVAAAVAAIGGTAYLARNQLGAAATSVGRGISSAGAAILTNPLRSATPPQLLRDTANFQNNADQAVRSLRNVSSALVNFSEVALKALLIKITALSYATYETAKSFVKINEEFSGLEVTLKSTLRSPDLARSLRQEVAKITAQSPLPFEGIAEIARGISLLPQTRARLVEQGSSPGGFEQSGFLQQSTRLVERMLTFRPDKNVADAVYSLREALGGEFRSLVRRFDIPLSVITNFSGKTAKELKSDPNVTLEALFKTFEKIISNTAIEERARQPSVVAQNIKEQLLTLPALAVGDAGFFEKFKDELTILYNSVQQINKKAIGDAGSPIEGTSLIEKYAKPISDSLIQLMGKTKTALITSFDSVLKKFNIGPEYGSLIERGLKSVSVFADWLGNALPNAITRFVSVTSALIPPLLKVGDIFLKLVSAFSRLAEFSPAMAALFAVTLPTMLRNLPVLIMRAVGQIPNIGAGGSNWGRDFYGTFARTAGQTSAEVATARGLTASGINPLTGRPRYFDAAGNQVRTPTPVAATFGATSALTGVARLSVASLTAVSLFLGAYELGQFLKDFILKFQTDRTDRFLSAKTSAEDKLTKLVTSEAEAKAFGEKFKKALAFDPGVAPLGQSYRYTPSGGRVALEQELKDKGFDPLEVQALFSDLTTTGKLIEAMAEIFREGGRLLPKVQDTTEAGLKALDELNDYFNQSGKNRPIRDIAAALKDPTYFKNSFAKAEELKGTLETGSNLAGTSFFKAESESQLKNYAPLAQVNLRFKDFIKEQNKVAQSRTELLEALGKDTAEGEAKIRASFTETVRRAKEALAKGAKGTSIVASISADFTLNEVIDRYGGFLRLMDKDASGRAEAIREAAQELTSYVSEQRENSNVAKIAAGQVLFFNTLDRVQKGELLRTREGLAEITELEQNISAIKTEGKVSLTQEFAPLIDEVRKSLTSADAFKENEPLVKLRSEEIRKKMLETIVKMMEILRDEFIKNAESAYSTARTGLTLAPVYSGVADYGGQSTIVTTIQKGRKAESLSKKEKDRRTSPTRIRNAQADIERETLLPEDSFPIGPGVDPLFAPPLPQVYGPQVDISQPQETPYDAVIAEKKAAIATAATNITQYQTIATEAKARLKQLDPAVVNAIQEISQILGAAENIRKAGPEMDRARTQFLASAKLLGPELGAEATKALTSIFGTVRNGEQGIDDLYAKMKAVSAFSTTFAAKLRADAEKAGARGDKTGQDRLEDAARRVDIDGAKAAQYVEDIESKQSPIKTFWEGLNETLGVSLKTIGDLTQAGVQAGQIISQNLGRAFGDFVTGAKSGKEAFRDFASSVIEQLARMAAEAATKQLLGLLINVASSAFGAYTGSFNNATGGAPYAGNAGSFAVPTAVAVAEGGPIRGGSGIKDDVPALLMGGEFVISKSAVQKYGEDYFDRLNSQQVPTFARGGMVGTVNSANPVLPTSPDVQTGSSSASPEMNFSMTVNVGSKGGDNEGESQVDQEDLARKWKAAMVRLIHEEQQPGGSLRR